MEAHEEIEELFRTVRGSRRRRRPLVLRREHKDGRRSRGSVWGPGGVFGLRAGTPLPARRRRGNRRRVSHEYQRRSAALGKLARAMRCARDMACRGRSRDERKVDPVGVIKRAAGEARHARVPAFQAFARISGVTGFPAMHAIARLLYCAWIAGRCRLVGSPDSESSMKSPLATRARRARVRAAKREREKPLRSEHRAADRRRLLRLADRDEACRRIRGWR